MALTNMSNKLYYKSMYHKGFTLIELLVVIAIIGILSTLGIFGFQSSLAKARDAQRRSNLHNLSVALQQYYNDYGNFPSTGGVWFGESTNYGSHTADYIPNPAGAPFTPKYYRTLPNDPKVNQANTVNAAECTAGVAGYLYRSDGKDYKFMAHCTPEQSPLGVKDPYYEPQHVGSWQISTDGAANWN